jgi:hypothetical protein
VSKSLCKNRRSEVAFDIGAYNEQSFRFAHGFRKTGHALASVGFVGPRAKLLEPFAVRNAPRGRKCASHRVRI